MVLALLSSALESTGSMVPHSTYAKRILSAVQRSPSSERADVLDFRERLYGVSDPEHVAWMYDRAPGTSEDDRALWTWRTGNSVEAHQGAIRTTLSIDGTPRTLSWAIDLFISPAYRARGIGALLPGLVIDEADVVAGTEVSEAAQKSFSRAGWTHLGTIPLWIRPIDVSNILRSRGRTALSRRIGPLVSTSLRWMHRASGVTRRHYRLVPGDRFDQRADDIWAACSPDWPVIARRDGEWLRWRWDDNPDFDVEILWLDKGGETVGWVVLADRDHNDLHAGFILDLLCRRSDLGALLGLVVDRFYDHGCDVGYLTFRGPTTNGIIRRRGFLGRDTQLAMMVFAQKLPVAEQVLVTDANRWYLTAGDSDIDRVRIPFVEDRT